MEKLYPTEISREKLVLVSQPELEILREKAKKFDDLSSGILSLKCAASSCAAYGAYGCSDCFSTKFCRDHIKGNLVVKPEIGYSCIECWVKTKYP